MANIDIEKFIADCIKMAEGSPSVKCTAEIISGYIFKRALKEQSLLWDGECIVKTQSHFVINKEKRLLDYPETEVPAPKCEDDCLIEMKDVNGIVRKIRKSDFIESVKTERKRFADDSFWPQEDIADLERTAAEGSKKIKETMETHPFFEHARKAGYQKGVSDMWWQVKHDAKECVVQTNSMSGNTVVVHLDSHYKAGDKVKVLVIKED